MKHYNIPVFIPHLGCPFKCIYCDQNRIAARSASPDPDHVTVIAEEYLSTLPSAGEVEIAFFGGNFTAIDRGLQEQYLARASVFVRQGRVAGIRLSTRPDAINQDVLDFLYPWGVRTIELGVQSLSPQVLQAVGRGYSPEQVWDASRLIQKMGMKLGIQLMPGLPGASYDRDLESARIVMEINPDMARIYPTVVLRDTPLHTLYIQGKYRPLAMQQAVELCADIRLLFQQRNIAVIRTGLHPGEDLLQEGAVVAGPFHPALGEMVEQEIFRRQAERAISRFLHDDNGFKSLALLVNHRDRSKITGFRRTNLQYLQQRFQLQALQVVGVEGQQQDSIGVAEMGNKHPNILLNRQEFISWYTRTVLNSR